MGTTVWVLWVLSSRIENRATIGLILLFLLFQFIAEGASGLRMYRFVNIFIAAIIISASLVVPQYAYKEDSRRASYLDHTPILQLGDIAPRMTYFNMYFKC